MKFAKELSDDLVPEWRLKYLDYKQGKKRVKAVARALAKINQTPRTPKGLTATNEGAARTPFHILNQDLDSPPAQTPDDSQAHFDEPQWESTTQNTAQNAGEGPRSQAVRALTGVASSQGLSPRGRANERSPLRGDQGGDQQGRPSASYGSIVATPSLQHVSIGPPSLELPDPAVSIGDPLYKSRSNLHANRDGIRRASSAAGDAYEIGCTHTPSKASVTMLPKTRHRLLPRRTFSTPDVGINFRAPLFRRLFSSSRHGQAQNPPDVPLEAYHEFDLRQAQFFNFLDKELDKVESFYKMKEQEAVDRLEVLHNQLRTMRDRRVHELFEEQQKSTGKANGKASANGLTKADSSHTSAMHDMSSQLIRPIENVFGIGNHAGKNSKALQDMVQAKRAAGELPANQAEDFRDFSRRKPRDDIPYRSAKRKLKLALQEYYRGLELLKSYTLLNQTAFRKMNKKYDKAVMARPTFRYMSDRVNKSWFVQSERLQRLIVECEDLYSRYFERSNHKAAVNKLRSSSRKHYYSASVFRNGIMLSAGVVLGIQGAVYATGLATGDDPGVRLLTNYLLQLYGGYLLSLVLFLLFVLVCRQWTRAKINYVFVFEFDTRHNLDWRQLAELPCLFSFLFGLILWLNFHQASPPIMFLWWPVMLIGITLIIMFLPFKILYWRSRGWLLYSLWRLFFAGIYAVEFRDFFLGDMFCSLTYMMQNIEVFFCLYASQWSDPGSCNSSNSRLLGFFSTLPGIWRALQCLRRYRDTKNMFPHLVNCGKYFCTILFYMTLSLYRIAQYTPYKAAFITFGILNSVYVSVWDLVMDWSLCNPYAHHPYLRETLGYKSVSFYYTAMIIDPILRFNWLLYVIVPLELQHSAVLSFFISLSEVARRAMWTVIRVENEHCTNVGRFRASRDVPLPYELEDKSVSQQSTPPGTSDSPDLAVTESAASAAAGAPTESASSHLGPATPATPATPAKSPSLLRRRRTTTAAMLEDEAPTPRKLNRVGTLLAAAHAQDFERKRRSSGTFLGLDGKVESPDAPRAAEEASSDEEDEDPGAESARLLGERDHDRRVNEVRSGELVGEAARAESAGDGAGEGSGTVRRRAGGGVGGAEEDRDP